VACCGGAGSTLGTTRLWAGPPGDIPPSIPTAVVVFRGVPRRRGVGVVRLALQQSVDLAGLSVAGASPPPGGELPACPPKHRDPLRNHPTPRQPGRPAQGAAPTPRRCPGRERWLTPVCAAVQGIVQHGAAQGGEAPAAPQVGLAHQGLAVVGGLGAGGRGQALGAARFPPDRPAGDESALTSRGTPGNGGFAPISQPVLLPPRPAGW